MKPSKQGDLDTACGFYAAVNAISLICPKVNRNDLFIALVQQWLKPGNNKLAIVKEGLGRNELNEILKGAVDYLRSNHGCT
ncbi:MAG: hypothetical protein Q9M23_08705, partial [Mariprofundaceae bacterium]|nr:hypothetical protein [Mariprofundaceae bacterium]